MADEMSGDEGQVGPGSTLPLAAPDGRISSAMIVVTRALPVSPAEIWPLWTTTEGICRWLVDDAHVELRIGGPFELYFLADGPEGQRGSEGCRVLAYVPERMLACSWNAPPNFPEQRAVRTWFVLELAETSTGAAVTLRHLGWPREVEDGDSDWAAVYSYFESAWENVLSALVRHFEPEAS